MAYSFKSIADVEVVERPSNSASVLIEEDGIIKKTPKTAVGGTGAGSEEMVVVTDYNYNIHEVPDDFYNKLKEAYNSKKIILRICCLNDFDDAGNYTTI